MFHLNSIIATLGLFLSHISTEDAHTHTHTPTQIHTHTHTPKHQHTHKRIGVSRLSRHSRNNSCLEEDQAGNFPGLKLITCPVLHTAFWPKFGKSPILNCWHLVFQEGKPCPQFSLEIQVAPLVILPRSLIRLGNYFVQSSKRSRL